MLGQIHLIRCRCFLPQFKNRDNPPNHEFPVFSIIDDDDNIKVKFSQCPNCGIVHKIVDICKSEIVQKEHLSSVLTINDIKISFPDKLIDVLEQYELDISKWEYIKFILENHKWGSFIVLASDTNSGYKQGKYLRIMSESVFLIEDFVREEFLSI